MNEKRRPKRLKNPPIVEAVAEFRFSSADESAGELLPGLLFPVLSGHMPKMERLPLHDIPKEVVLAADELRYKPRIRFAGDGTAVNLGFKVCNVAVAKPYPGWDVFGKEMAQVLKAIDASKVKLTVERVSVLYSNLLCLAEGESELDVLNLKLGAGAVDFSGRTLTFRGEFERDGVTAIVAVSTQTTMRDMRNGEEVSGTLLNVDAILNVGRPFSPGQLTSAFEKVHDCEKGVFFDLVPSKVIERFGPIWE